jgi:hypothetical protein
MIQRWMMVVPSLALAVAAGQVAAIVWPSEAQAQQAPEWRELGGVNGVELWEVRTGRATCYVTSAGGVSCK